MLLIMQASPALTADRACAASLLREFDVPRQADVSLNQSWSGDASGPSSQPGLSEPPEEQAQPEKHQFLGLLNSVGQALSQPFVSATLA